MQQMTTSEGKSLKFLSPWKTSIFFHLVSAAPENQVKTRVLKKQNFEVHKSQLLRFNTVLLPASYLGRDLFTGNKQHAIKVLSGL